jgi:hypothetical protein
MLGNQRSTTTGYAAIGGIGSAMEHAKTTALPAGDSFSFNQAAAIGTAFRSFKIFKVIEDHLVRTTILQLCKI